MKVCVGGTFNNLHKGHKFLLKKAFESAGENGFVYIGLAKGSLIKNKKNILRGIKTQGIYLQLTPGDILPNFIKWENLENSQIFHIFKALLSHIKTPPEHFKALALFCTYSGLKEEYKAAEKMYRQVSATKKPET